MGGLVLDLFAEFLVRALVRFYAGLGTGAWIETQGTITKAELTESFTWLTTARITYSYKFRGEQFEGTDAKPFLNDNSAKYHLSTHARGSKILVRVNPNNPSISLYRAPVKALWGSEPVER